MQTALEETGASSRAHADGSIVYRKAMVRIIPFFFISYIVNQLDRLNIAFAKLRFMHDIGLSDMAYGFGAGLFFIGYVVFEVPSNLYLQRAGGRATFIRIMVLWGLLSCAMALVRNPTELYVARFLLGAAEAGFVPGVILYLTFWFPASYRARITSYFFMAITFAGIFGGPLSGWILHSFTSYGVLKDWQWMFVLEGVPAVVLGVVAYFYLDNHPNEASWLTSDEKQIIQQDLRKELESRKSVGEASLYKAFRDPKVYIAGFIYFSIIAGNNALTLWMPSLIKSFGIDDVLAIGLLSSLPYIAGAVTMLVVSRSSDARVERRWHVALPLIATGVSYALVGYMLKTPVLAMAILAIAAGGIYSAISIFWTIPPAYLTGAAAAGGIAIVSSLGMTGGFASPIILGWATTMTGNLQSGFQTIGAILILGAVALIKGIPAAILDSRSKE